MKKGSFTFSTLLILLIVFSGSTVLNAQTSHWESIGPEGGLILDVEQDESNPAVFYALCNYNVLYKSTNSGASWFILPSFTGYATSITTKSSKLLVHGNGSISCSTNGGTTWNSINNIYSIGSGQWYGSSALAFKIDPVTPTTYHTAINYYSNGSWVGAYAKSTNEGTTWTNYLTNQTNNPSSLAVDPRNTQTVYMAGNYYTESETSYHNFIVKTTNGGTTFSSLPEPPYSTVSFLYEIIADPFNAGVIFIGTGAGVYRSSDDGVTWTRINNIVPTFRKFHFDSRMNTLFAVCYGGAFKTTDGISWSCCTNGLGSSVYNLYNIASDISSPSNLMIASGTGIYKTINGGNTFSSCNTGLTGCTIAVIKCSPGQTGLYAASENLGVFKTTNGLGKTFGTSTPTWTKWPLFYTCTALADLYIKPSDPNHIIALEGGG